MNDSAFLKALYYGLGRRDATLHLETSSAPDPVSFAEHYEALSEENGPACLPVRVVWDQYRRQVRSRA